MSETFEVFGGGDIRDYKGLLDPDEREEILGVDDVLRVETGDYDFHPTDLTPADYLEDGEGAK
jgi:hypothetical protein